LLKDKLFGIIYYIEHINMQDYGGQLNFFNLNNSLSIYKRFNHHISLRNSKKIEENKDESRENFYNFLS